MKPGSNNHMVMVHMISYIAVLLSLLPVKSVNLHVSHPGSTLLGVLSLIMWKAPLLFHLHEVLHYLNSAAAPVGFQTHSRWA